MYRVRRTTKRYTLQERRAEHQQYLERVARRREQGIGSSDPMQPRQTVTPGSGNAAQLNYDHRATAGEGGEPCTTPTFLSGSHREAREIVPRSL